MRTPRSYRWCQSVLSTRHTQVLEYDVASHKPELLQLDVVDVLGQLLLKDPHEHRLERPQEYILKGPHDPSCTGPLLDVINHISWQPARHNIQHQSASGAECLCRNCLIVPGGKYDCSCWPIPGVHPPCISPQSRAAKLLVGHFFPVNIPLVPKMYLPCTLASHGQGPTSSRVLSLRCMRCIAVQQAV